MAIRTTVQERPVVGRRERERLVHLAVEQIDYDGVAGEIAIRFRALALKALAAEMRGDSAGPADAGTAASSAAYAEVA